MARVFLFCFGVKPKGMAIAIVFFSFLSFSLQQIWTDFIDLGMYGQNRTYSEDMPCAPEINSNDGFKQACRILLLNH